MTSFLAAHGLWAVFVLIAIDAVFPAASELVMLYAGALASGALQRQLVVFGNERSGPDAYLAVALAGTIGYMVGAIAGWAIGLYGGRPFLERRGRWFHLSLTRLERAERWFHRWEDWAVFLGRLTPLVRSFISIPAGVFELPFVRYTVLTRSAARSGASASPASARRSARAGSPSTTRSATSTIALALAVVALAVYLIVRRRRSTTMGPPWSRFRSLTSRRSTRRSSRS